MKKCINCGTEFEGNFCPKCGASAAKEKGCPKCGNKLKADANFCEWCGYSFANSPAQSKPVETPETFETQKPAEVKSTASDFKEKLFRILNIVPAAAFALYSVLLFVFFAAPVASLFGESSGSAYSLKDEIPELSGEILALFIFAALSLLCAAVIWAVRLHNNTKFRRVKIFGKQFKLSEAVGFSSYLFYFLFFLMGCIVCGKVNGIFMSAGACPILVLVFAIVFAFADAGALVGRYFIKKKFPEYAQREEGEANAQYEAYKAHIAEIVNAGAPAEPQKVEMPKAPEKAKKIVNSKARVAFFAFCFVAVAAIVFTFALMILDAVVLANDPVEITSEYYEPSIFDNWYFNVYLLSGAAAALLAVSVISAFIRVKTVNSSKVLKKGFLIFTAVLSICAICAFSIYLALEGCLEVVDPKEYYISSHDIEKESICCIAASGVIALFGLISFIWSLAVIGRIKRIQKNAEKLQELNEELSRYDENKANYAGYLKQCEEYKKQCEKYKRYVKVYNKMTT